MKRARNASVSLVSLHLRTLSRGSAFSWCVALAAAALTAAALVSPREARAQEPVAPPIDEGSVNPVHPRPRILSGAWEVNFGGTFSNTNGVHYGSFDGRAGTFRPAGEGLLGLETLVSYAHYGGDDFGDLQEWVTYQRGMDGSILGAGPGGLWPYVGVGAGVGQAWEAPSTDTRFPIGFVLGARLLQGRASAARVEYRYRYYAGDRDGGYVDDGWFVGYSFFLNNAADR
jgi:hypothetical protein